MLCCAVVCCALIFMSTALRSSLDPGDAAGPAAVVPRGPEGGPEGFVTVERKVFKQAQGQSSAAPATSASSLADASAGGASTQKQEVDDNAAAVSGEEQEAVKKSEEAAKKSEEARGQEVGALKARGQEVGALKDRIKLEKRKLFNLKTQEKRLEREQAFLHVDHAKQQVLEERKVIDKEEKFERKEENTLQKEKKIVSHFRKDVSSEEKLLSELETAKGGREERLKKAEALDEDEHELEEANKKQVKKFNNLHQKEMDRSLEVQDVAATWKDIQAEFGASKNIMGKHMKEEKRHAKIQKKAAKTVEQFNQLVATHESLVQKEAELQRRLHGAQAAATGKGVGL